MISSVASRELRGLYATPVAWILLATAQLLLAWMMFAQLEIYLTIQPQLTASGSQLGIIELVIIPTFNAAALVLLLLIPLLGCRSFSSEMQSGRISLLLSSPISATRLVLGKWLGLLLACMPFTGLVMLMTLTLESGSNLDVGQLFSSAIGLLLFTSAAAALTVWLSSITRQPMIAASLACGLLFLLWLLDSHTSQGLSTSLALSPHLLPFFNGLLETSNIIYFVSFSMLSLGLAIHQLWRLGGGR